MQAVGQQHTGLFCARCEARRRKDSKTPTELSSAYVIERGGALRAIVLSGPG